MPTYSFPKEKIKILLLEGIHPTAVNTFKRAGYTNIQTSKKGMLPEELAEAIKDVHLLGIRSKTQVTSEVIAKAKKLMAVGCFCIGTNQVDLKAATEAGVAVFNSPYSNTRSVAELVIAEMIMLMRKIIPRHEGVRKGQWMKDAKESYEVRGKTLGIIGYGHIGSQVSILAEGLGLNVIYHDIEPKLPLGNATPAKNLDDLLKRSDIVTLHVPATPQTANMMTAKKIGLMQKGAMLLNLSRGNVVDLDAAAKAMNDGHLGGMAVDVYPVEPKSKEDPFETILQKSGNVILTPHIGGSTVEAQENIGADAANKLINFVDTGSTIGCFTLPPLNLAPQENAHRLLHLHKNVPGVLSELNTLLSSFNANISGQYLNTNDQLGYVVFDINKKNTKTIEKEIRKVKHTLRTRSLY